MIAASEWPDLNPVPLRARPDFLSGEIAAGVLGPGVACDLQGAHARVAAAYIEVPALPAASANAARPALEARHDRIADILPNAGEWALADVAECVMPPEGIGVHIAEIVDIGDIYAACIAAPLYELSADMVRRLWKALFHPVIEENPIRIVIAGHELLLDAALHIGPCRLEQRCHNAAGNLPSSVVAAVLISAPTIVQV